MEQRFQKLQSERDELHANFVTAVQEVVQKANFKKLLLERKVVALADSLEKKDAQVNFTFSIKIDVHGYFSAQRNLGCI